jgi:hypothetical protein
MVFQTYLGLYVYVLKLATRALARRWIYLFAAPVMAVLYMFALRLITSVVGGSEGAGFIAGFVVASLQAAVLSFLLFVGRAIVEQRRLRFDDIQTGFLMYWGDLLNILFVLWVVSYLISALRIPVLGGLLYYALLVAPIFEAVALTPVRGATAYQSAWRFLQRDAPAWLIGLSPMLLLLPLSSIIYDLIFRVALNMPLEAARWFLAIVPMVLVFTALFAIYIYRGILFLTLDNISPRARAERFGFSSVP